MGLCDYYYGRNHIYSVQLHYIVLGDVLVISIIIPIYNSEKYLDKCLSYVKNQTFTDFEVIMVDSNSTDGSVDICLKFADMDSRFKYFYNENVGVSSARNKGLEEATGDYIAFIDSDDYVDIDYLEALSAPLEERKWDMIQCGMNIITKENMNQLDLTSCEFHDLEYAETVLKRDFHIFLFITTTSKLYRRDIIVNNDITFDENVAQSEDCLFNTQLLEYIKDVKHIEYVGYNYIRNDFSVTTKNLLLTVHISL